MTEHTPTPWHVDGLYITTREPPSIGSSIADCGKSPIIPRRMQAANAAFIVKAVNAHDRLVEALEFIRDGYDNHDVNHVDYRVKVYQVALDVLAAVSAVGESK